MLRLVLADLFPSKPQLHIPRLLHLLHTSIRKENRLSENTEGKDVLISNFLSRSEWNRRDKLHTNLALLMQVPIAGKGHLIVITTTKI